MLKGVFIMSYRFFNSFILILFFCCASSVGKVYAHHGGVSTAFGPGAPVETASPMTIGKGKFLLYEKIEFASLVQYGFKYGERNGIRGFYNNGPEDTIGESYTTNDLKMSFLGGFTVQTGDITNEDNKGNRFDMGMQTGFAAP